MTRVTEIILGNLPPHQHLIHRCLSLENLVIDVNSRIWPGLWSPDRLKSSSFRPAFSFRAFSENADQFHSSADCWLAGQRGSLHIKSACVLLWLSSGVMMHGKVALRRYTALENYEGGKNRLLRGNEGEVLFCKWAEQSDSFPEYFRSLVQLLISSFFESVKL